VILAAMIEILQTPERCLLTTADLELSCDFRGDRWGHSVVFGNPVETATELKSVEGSAAEAALPSPAYQELLVEEKSPDLVEVQLFGRSGKSLYAAAIALNIEAKTIDFDISERTRGELKQMTAGSVYAFGEGWEVNGGAATCPIASGGDLTFSVVEAAGWAKGEIRADGSKRLRVGHFDPAGGSVAGSGQTLRWLYRISWG